jgi:hypothetical protein
MNYILDANVFIQAHRFYYPFDLFPGFWNWLKQENKKKSIGTIDWVYNEIKTGNDQLFDWMKNLDFDQWVLKCDDEQTQAHYADIANQVMEDTHYTQQAKDLFLSRADSWLIAKVRALGITLVTEERSNPQKRNQIFIPDICKKYNIPCINTIGLIRKLGGHF